MTSSLVNALINARSFGAVGDGWRSDREAIQRAVDYASASGHGVVFLPAGHYNLGARRRRLRSRQRFQHLRAARVSMRALWRIPR